jgi:hypothetical protein
MNRITIPSLHHETEFVGFETEVRKANAFGQFPGRIKFSAIGVGRWERKREYPTGNLFSNSTI